MKYAEMQEEMAIVSRAFDLLQQGDFCGAEELLQASVARDKTQQLGYSHLGLGILCAVRGMLSCSASDHATGMRHLRDGQCQAARQFSAVTQLLYPDMNPLQHLSLQLFVDAKACLKMGDDRTLLDWYLTRGHCELVMAECMLLRMLLAAIATSNGAAPFVGLCDTSEMPHLRACYTSLYYAKERLSQFDSADAHYRSGVQLCWGLFGILTALLPDTVSALLGTAGFQPSIDESVALLEKAACHGGLHAVPARIVLVSFHLTIGNDTVVAETALAGAFPTVSPLSQYFVGLLRTRQGNRSLAIDAFLSVRLCRPDGKQQHLLCYWQAIQCHAASQQWIEALHCIRMLRASAKFPGAVVSLYLEAACLQASSGRSTGPLSVEVRGLLQQMLSAAESRQQKRGPGDALESLALARARAVIDRNEAFFLPQYELLLVWGRLREAAQGALIAEQIREVLGGSPGRLTDEQTALGWLMLAMLSPRTASTELILHHVLPRERNSTKSKSSYISALARCELVETLADHGQCEAAIRLLRSLERELSLSRGGMLQKPILFRIAQLKYKIN